VNKLQLYISFYKSIAIVNISISISVLSVIYVYGISPFLYLFWFKIITLFFILYANNTYKSKEYFYFLNLGVSKKNLWISSALIDIVIFILLLIIAMKIR